MAPPIKFVFAPLDLGNLLGNYAFNVGLSPMFQEHDSQSTAVTADAQRIGQMDDVEAVGPTLASPTANNRLTYETANTAPGAIADDATSRNGGVQTVSFPSLFEDLSPADTVTIYISWGHNGDPLSGETRPMLEWGEGQDWVRMFTLDTAGERILQWSHRYGPQRGGTQVTLQTSGVSYEGDWFVGCYVIAPASSDVYVGDMATPVVSGGGTDWSGAGVVTGTTEFTISNFNSMNGTGISDTEWLSSIRIYNEAHTEAQRTAVLAAIEAEFGDTTGFGT